MNLRPSGYERDFTQLADGRRHSCFQSFRAVARDWESRQVHFRIHESPPVWTRSGQSLRARSHDRVFRAFNRGDRVVANHTVKDTIWASKGRDRRSSRAPCRALRRAESRAWEMSSTGLFGGWSKAVAACAVQRRLRHSRADQTGTRRAPHPLRLRPLRGPGPDGARLALAR